MMSEIARQDRDEEPVNDGLLFSNIDMQHITLH